MSGTSNPFNPDVFRHAPGVPYPWQVFDRVTIAMVTWNRRALSERALGAIYRHAGMPFELIVVDNGSTDGTAEMLRALAQEQGNVRLQLNPENIGKNRALRQIQAMLGDDGLVVCFDNDVEMVSSLFLVHLQKAFHAVRLAKGGSAEAVLGVRMINCEEHGFRHGAAVSVLPIPSEANGPPRTSFAAVNKDRASPERRYDEQVLVTATDFVLGGCFACPAALLRDVPFGAHYPGYIGSDDGVASAHWASRGVLMGYLENGPIGRHLDWPYSEEKIRLYNELTQARAVTDLSYILWKIRRFFG
jgi:glycosyltransferase involved in cell wall biosynthesis